MAAEESQVVISAVLPLYNGRTYIEECLCSIQRQTFTDWEFIIVNEYGSDDGCAEIVRDYGAGDPRIRLLQNEEKLGLAESLNRGIQAAVGEFIARVDVDDPSDPERFEKQLSYMREHPDVALCGTMQRSVLPDRSYVEEVPREGEELKAGLLFGCEISHCSVFFRRELFLKNGWKYDGNRLGEDFDLWTRIMFQARLVNLPEVLVSHRWGFDNISLEKGERLQREVCEINARSLREFGIEVPEEDLPILAGWRSRPEGFARRQRSAFLKKSYRLLTELEAANRRLHKIEEAALHRILWKRWNWVCKTCGIFFREFTYEQIAHEGNPRPAVSVIMPVYRAMNTLRESIDSILLQEYEDWELLLICEYGNEDGSTELARYYEKYDHRIRVIENKEHLGLPESLNLGIREARGAYLARLDADDLSNAKRLSTQVHYMEHHPKTGITQFYQHYFGSRPDGFIHRPPQTAAGMRAKLLFFCDACHSTVMFRKETVEKYQLYYNKSSELEDYELWTRMVKATSFETIPLIYGEYRVGAQNISLGKETAIQSEMCQIIKRQLSENLGMEVPKEKCWMLGSWRNVFLELPDSQKQTALTELRNLLLDIWKANQRVRFYGKRELLKTITAKWRFSKYNEPWFEPPETSGIYEALEIPTWFGNCKRGAYRILIKAPLKMLQSLSLHIGAKNIEHLSNVTKDVSEAQFYRVDKQIERWTWERYQRLEKRLAVLEQENIGTQNALTDFLFRQNRVPYRPGERIRIVFLFQIPSFWPSWESFFAACTEDERVDARLVFLDETNSEKTQMQHAKDFLEEKGLPYELYERFPMEEFAPHAVVIQTPYDEWHRQRQHWSNVFRMRGYRLVYIPYGVEISDTEDSHRLHFQTNVINNCWRIYTFSDCMKEDYWKYCGNRRAVRVTGLPRFDAYDTGKPFPLPAYVEKRRAGRPIVLWKVHFPKTIVEKGVNVAVTPELEEYVRFAEKIREYEKLFFILMPHPKFLEERKDPRTREMTERIVSCFSEAENAWVEEREDYRASLVNANCIIIDRSAVMVEAGALNVPVLFLTNRNYYEPVTGAIEPLVKSYEQGNTCEDMIRFLERFCEGKDVGRVKREKAYAACIPFRDGLAGERIKEDIVSAVMEEED